MPAYKFQVIHQMDNALPEHGIVNTVHMDNPDPLADVGAICGDMAEGFLTAWYGSLTASQVTVKAYNLGVPPQYPIAEEVRNAGTYKTSPGPREIALCLSFYSERNLPRQRGRLYLPMMAVGSVNTARPNVTIQNLALGVGTMLAGLGGIDWDWGIWSPTDQQFRAVTHAWVDDEWDTVRSRGLDPSSRVESAVGA